MKIKIKKLHKLSQIPAYQTSGAAAVDLVACIDETIELAPGEQAIIGTGIAIDIRDANVCAKVYPRSGLGKRGLVLGNGTGIIDSDYQGEIKLVALNRNTKDCSYCFGEGWATERTDETGYEPCCECKSSGGKIITINPGERIAQMIFVPILRAEFEEVDEFEATERGEGGFNSTGLK